MRSIKKSTLLSLTASLGLSLAVSPLQLAIAKEGSTRTGDKPNFVTIVIDDMGFSDIGAYGSQTDTPNLDALINSGTRLTNFYSAPTSTPARAMFFTGKNNHSAGVGNMSGYMSDRPIQKGQPGYVGLIPKEVKTFPEVLQANGYHTIMTGKWDLSGEDGLEPGQDAFDRGFTNTLVLLPGGDVQFISDDQGKLLTSQPPGYYQKLGRASPYSKNGVEFSDFPPNAYSTEFYTDSAIEFLDGWVKEGKQKPFHLNVAHIAPHAPFQAPADLVQKYVPIYSKGWDVLRAERFAKQKTLGLVPADAELPPRNNEAKAWDSLTPEQQQIEAQRMAVYAGMVEMLDRSVGKLVQHLKDIGEYENTVFFVFSDNGAALQEAGSPAKQKHVNENFIKESVKDLATMGSAKSFISATPGIGMLSNTPLSRYKSETFEGGIHTMAFVHYPKATKGGRYDCVTSGMDIAPTILEMAGATYPADQEPMDGVSMANILTSGADLTACPDRSVAFEMDSAIMVRKGDWKLAQRWDSAHQRWDSRIYLFNIKEDPFELNDRYWTNPDEFSELSTIYRAFADKNKVIPIGHRLFSGGGLLDPLVNLKEATDAIISGGTQVNYAGMIHNTSATAKVGDIVDIAAEIYPSPSHVGQNGQVVVVGHLMPDNGPQRYVAFSGYGDPQGGFGIRDWDGELATLPTYMDFSGKANWQPGLPRLIQVPIYEGGISSTGTFNFWVGYRLEDGTLVSNFEKVVTLKVEPKS